MKMPIVTPIEAQQRGFLSLTVGVSAKREPNIIAGMEFTLAPAGAVWIQVGDDEFEAARLRRQLVPLGGRSNLTKESAI